MATVKPLTEKEVRFARAFLHATHANEANGYLLLAVIAWLRGSAKAFAFTQYASRAAGVAALIRTLKVGGAKAGYAIVLKRLMDATPAADQKKREAQQVAQAMDFLNLLAMSKWDATHFGTQTYTLTGSPAAGQTKVPGPLDLTKNSLIKIWAQLTGKPIPSSWFTDPAPKPPPPPPPRKPGVKGIDHGQPKPNYIDPYAAGRMYAERLHTGDFLLGNDTPMG